MSKTSGEIQERKGEKEPISLIHTLELGWFLMYIRQSKVFDFKLTAEGDNFGILDAFEKIEHILGDTDFDAVVLEDIKSKRRSYESNHLETDDGTVENPKLDGNEYTSLIESVNTWNRLLKKELENEKRVAISSSGLFDTEEAMRNPNQLFDNGSVWQDLPDRTKDDLTEACRALAFGCTTSSVIMSLRAVESRLQKWYKSETSRSIEKRTFGQVLSELDDTYSKSDRPAILSHLDYLKERRNQVAHPNRSPGRQEAESTLIMVRETISDIHKQI